MNSHTEYDGVNGCEEKEMTKKSDECDEANVRKESSPIDSLKDQFTLLQASSTEISKPLSKTGEIADCGLADSSPKGFISLDNLSFTISIKTDKDSYTYPNMLNRFCDSETKIISCEINDVHSFGKCAFYGKSSDEDEENDESDGTVESDEDDDEDDYRKLRDEDYLLCAHDEGEIRMASATYTAPHGKSWFSLNELLDVICKDETITRMDKSKAWFGGVDVHHIFFEGLRFENGVYSAIWGS